ncbi:hypothetical protein [Nonomuraea basaltis]|uniref:hypothetical protein n=1 Tax=Nonomuraea basaltis TaxID=2495887 RepID=UPI001F0E1F71|nr:hypothetical protein [Nonomuraea basaltis]
MTVIDMSPHAGAGVSAATTIHLSGEIDIFTSKALRQQLLNTLRTAQTCSSSTCPRCPSATPLAWPC